jgi:hypothetical protein
MHAAVPLATDSPPTAAPQAKPKPPEQAPAKPKPQAKAIPVEPEPKEAPVADVAAPTPAPVAAGDDALAALLASWPSIVDRIGKNPANKPIIDACRPVEVSGATIVLGFPETKAFLRDVAERKRNVLEAEIGHVLGRAVAVRCVASNVELVTNAPQVDLVEHARRVFEDDLVDVAEVE